MGIRLDTAQLAAGVADLRSTSGNMDQRTSRINAWQNWDRAAHCSAFQTGPDGSRSCLEGSTSLAALLADVALESLWLWPMAALLAGVTVALLRVAPRWWWVLPSLLWGGYVVVEEARIPEHLTRITDQQLLSVMAPMAEREGLSRDRLLTSRSLVNDMLTTARVDGIGSNQTIMVGFVYGHPMRRDFGSVVRNGFYLTALSDAALRSVMGHELAHIRQNHTTKRLVFSLLLIGLLCWRAGRLCLRMQPIGLRLGVQCAVDRWTCLALLSATMPILFILLDAGQRSLTLALEFEADRIGLDISREPDGFAEFALLDAAGGRFELEWWERWMTYHPSNADRVRQAIRWQQRYRPDQPIAIPDAQRLLIPANRPYPAQP